MNKNLLEVKELKQHFSKKGGVLYRQLATVYAVDGISFNIKKGETIGLVGESGCGKTTVGRSILKLYNPTSGEVIFDGKKLSTLKRNDLQALRRDMQIIFQDPFESLNARHTIGYILEEPFIIHKIGNTEYRKKEVRRLLNRVGLSENAISRYPHEFSGGQRQRIGIARAIALNPKFIVCDEPVSALDVSIQSQVLNLLQDLQEDFGLTYLFVAHNLSVVEHISDRVAVMYLGKIVELTSRQELFNNPQHPYTQALISAIPIPKPNLQRERIILQGEVPSPQNPPKGCRFHPRCPFVMDHCSVQEPRFLETRPDHWVACHLVTPATSYMG
jgi:oligopeptide/dipeptide ABC transporter ATP-binding protein